MSLSQEILEEMYNLYNQKLELKKLSEKIADYLIKFKIIDIWIEDKFFLFYGYCSIK